MPWPEKNQRPFLVGVTPPPPPPLPQPRILGYVTDVGRIHNPLDGLPDTIQIPVL